MKKGEKTSAKEENPRKSKAEMNLIELGETIIEANEALMEADKQNVPRFETVNQLVRENLQNLKKSKLEG